MLPDRQLPDRQPGVALASHFFEVPLDHSAPSGEKITVFARELVAVEHAGRDDLPWLLYLQGGPGMKSPRPVSRKTGWLDRALREYRVLLLDQRGTGRSTPASQADPGRTRIGKRAGQVPHPLQG